MSPYPWLVFAKKRNTSTHTAGMYFLCTFLERKSCIYGLCRWRFRTVVMFLIVATATHVCCVTQSATFPSLPCFYVDCLQRGDRYALHPDFCCLRQVFEVSKAGVPKEPELMHRLNIFQTFKVR